MYYPFVNSVFDAGNDGNSVARSRQRTRTEFD